MPSHPILPIYFLFVETLSINLRKNNISKNGNFPLFSLLTINCQKWANYRLQNGQMWFFYIGTIKSDLYQGIKVKINDMKSNNYCCLMVYCAFPPCPFRLPRHCPHYLLRKVKFTLGLRAQWTTEIIYFGRKYLVTAVKLQPVPAISLE